MRNPSVLLLLLLGACGTQDSLSNNGAPIAAPGETPSVPAQAVQTATLVGLYESGGSGTGNQMCVLDRATGNARFGLVVRGAGEQGCSGAGEAVRQGDTLRLTMAGDEACTIEARIEGTRIAFPAQLAPGCAYYCSSGAGMAGVTLDKTGGTPEDAMRAVDLVGDRLCAGR
jgi:hypothetical protein